MTERGEAELRRLRVVAFGGGGGLSQLLRSLRLVRLPLELTAVVAVSDDGGSSGRLRALLGMPAVGDARTCLAALCEPGWTALLEQRLGRGGLAGHAVGNLLIAGEWRRDGSLTRALEHWGRRTRAIGRVVPATEASVRLIARRTDGSYVHHQRALRAGRGALAAVALTPHAPASPAALQALSQADRILLAPGSLYSSLAASLMPAGLMETLRQRRAPCWWVMNLLPQEGETGGLSADEECAALERQLGEGLFDGIVADVQRAPSRRPRRVGLLRGTDPGRHDPARLARALEPLLRAGAPVDSLRAASFRSTLQA